MASEQRKSNGNGNGQVNGALRGAGILVVDDEEGMLEVCAETLARTGLPVATERDPRRVLERLRRERFRLLVLEVWLPSVNGIDLVRQARELDPELEVLVVSGQPSLATVLQCLRLGAADFFAKPFDPEELLASARSALDARRVREEHRRLLAAQDPSGDEPLDDSVGFFALRDRVMRDFEAGYLRTLLRRHKGNVTRAARDARIPRGTCYRLLANHDLDPATFR
ncbi:MAG: response regulator [Planctomycetota bacterium]